MSHPNTQHSWFRPSRCLRLVLAVFALFVLTPGSLRADVIYDSLPPIPPGTNGQPGNVVSEPYFVNQFNQWGDYIRFVPGNWLLNSATVTMSAFAPMPNGANPAGWSDPRLGLTLTLYNVDHSGPNPGVGSVITSSTINPTIPWHGNNGFQGTAFNVNFPLNNVNVPSNEVIFGISYNSSLFGPNPIGVSGPWDMLNVAFGRVPPPPLVGTNVEEGVFVNAAAPSQFFTYTDPNAVYGRFQRDTLWGGDTPAIQFIGQQAPAGGAVPEPASLAVFAALGVTALGLRRRKAGV